MTSTRATPVKVTTAPVGIQRPLKAMYCLFRRGSGSAAFFDSPRRGVLVCLFAMQLIACGSVPDKTGQAVLVDSDSVSDEVNPYMLNRQPVAKKAQVEFDKAVAAMADQKWKVARKHLQSITESYPELSGPWLNLGIVHLELAQPEQAMLSIERAIAANGNNLDAYNHLAALHRDQGDFVSAEALYHQALVVWPGHGPSHLNLGILYDIYMGKFVEAAAHYQAYQELQGEPDRRVAGWLMDLKRRPQMLARSEQTQ